MEPESKQKSAVRGIKRIDLAYVELASSENARDINRDIVLEIIRSRQPVARADLARASGLQPSTISAIVDQLLKESWISEGEVSRHPRGRPSTLLSLNSSMVILVADIRPLQAIVALVDLNGHFLLRESIPLVKDPGPSMDRIATAMQSMRAAFPGRSFEGIGISVPGRVDPDSQRLPNLKWADFSIKEAIEAKMDLQVELANAANACLLAELWSGRLDGIRNAVLITVSEGIGGAILANGQIITSRSGLAGEFGHSPIDPAGPLCGCGQHGCWEVFASSTAALRYYAELNSSHCASIQELLALADDDDNSAVAAVTRQAFHLGRGLRLITAALSPEVILIAGDLTKSWSRFGPVIERELKNTMLAGSPPVLEVTRDGELSRLRGAAAVVLQRHSGYHSSSHLNGTMRRTRTKAPAPSE
jgi:predicted NBD/HSP70 family sugar kinase